MKQTYIRRPRTTEAYTLYINNLQKFFGEFLLSQITIDLIRDYQHLRIGQKACASYVNHEVNALSQILREADLWHIIEKRYKQLPAPQWTRPKVLSREDKQRFFQVAASKPEWMAVFLAVKVTANTSAAGIELRQLQMRHLFLDQEPPVIHIPDGKVKNQFRARVIPLNPDALDAMKLLVERAQKIGAWRQDHYLFPYRVNRKEYDATRPASPSFLRASFHKMREAAALPWLQPRHFRNQAITELFESGAPDETIIAIAGHQSINMSRAYSKIRVEAKAAALNALGSPQASEMPEPPVADSGPAFAQMRKVAQLVKETGIDVAAALQIVRAWAFAAVASADAAMGDVIKKPVESLTMDCQKQNSKQGLVLP